MVKLMMTIDGGQAMDTTSYKKHACELINI
jgi:hypothetical protein